MQWRIQKTISAAVEFPLVRGQLINSFSTVVLIELAEKVVVIPLGADFSDSSINLYYLIGGSGSDTSIRASSPELAETQIFRPPSTPTGIHCLIFPDSVSIERNAIMGTTEDSLNGVQGWGISVNTTINTSCGEGEAQWDIAVTTTNNGSLANVAYRLLIPSRR